MLAQTEGATYLTSCAGLPREELPAGVKGSFTLLGDLYAEADGNHSTKRTFLAGLCPTISSLAAKNALRPLPVEVVGGLEEVKAGLERMVAGDYSFTKLVAMAKK